jgi:hypothetical protein
MGSLRAVLVWPPSDSMRLRAAALAGALSAWRPSELTRVRAASWAGAALLAALALMLAAQRFPNAYGPAGGAEIAAIDVMIEQRARFDPPRPPKPAPRQVAYAPPSPAAARTGAGLSVRLWSYDSSGRILFANAEQYNRCIAARAQGRDEADCPSAAARGDLALAPGARDYADLSFSGLDEAFARDEAE